MADPGIDPRAGAPPERKPRPNAAAPPRAAGPPPHAAGSAEVRLRDEAFFAPIVRRNLEVALFHGHAELERNGTLSNFRLAAGRAPGPYRGVHYFDSDAYKWLEAASLALAH